MIKNLTKIFIAVIVILALITTFYMRDFIFAKNIATSAVSEFEDAIYSNNSTTAMSMIAPTAHIYHLFNDTTHNYYQMFVENLDLFESGFEITNINSSYLHRKGIEEPSKYISIRIAKKSRKDGEQRDHFQVALVKEKSDWLVERYYFPDYVDY